MVYSIFVACLCFPIYQKTFCLHELLSHVVSLVPRKRYVTACETCNMLAIWTCFRELLSACGQVATNCTVCNATTGCSDTLIGLEPNIKCVHRAWRLCETSKQRACLNSRLVGESESICNKQRMHCGPSHQHDAFIQNNWREDRGNADKLLIGAIHHCVCPKNALHCKKC